MTVYKKNLFQRLFINQPPDHDVKDLLKSLTEQDDNLDSILDRGIAFEENVDCRFVTYTSNAAPNTADTVAHDLGKVPQGFIVIALDKAGIIYNGGTFTNTDLILKCNVASVTVTILVF